MEYMVGRIKTYANNFWIGCEGQAYLRDQTLSCGSSGGNVVIDSVKGPMKQPPAMCSFGGGQWTIWLSTGEIASHGFLHEIGHGWVGPFSSEEYNCMNQGAGVCIQAAMYGGGEGFNKWCDTENCVSHQECWTKIQATHSWAHPGPGGTSPTCNVTIQ
ncbi:MAG: hypothetical protein E3J72_03565 [Planctomycetota bacterium]|nr:MAG: hypothetical protein E3J72_03565 [Planctomycetota bacterium]